MTDPSSHDDLLRQKDEEIKNLRHMLQSKTAEAAWYEGQATHASSAASSLIDVVKECFEGFSLLLKSYRLLSKSTSECSQNINQHFIEHINGRSFDPEYVRLQVKLMTNDLQSSTESMRVAGDKFFGTVESMKAIQEEMLKAPPPFGESLEKNQ